jgi:hypothetical protein
VLVVGAATVGGPVASFAANAIFGYQVMLF